MSSRIQFTTILFRVIFLVSFFFITDRLSKMSRIAEIYGISVPIAYGFLLSWLIEIISDSVIKALCQNDDGRQSRYTYMILICVQSAVSSYFCFFDFACPDNYLGLLIFYLLLAIVVAILHSRQLNENKWKVPWIDLSLNEISVILMEIVLVVLAYQSPKIIAAGWIMILEIDASKWPLKISRIPDFIKYLKEHFPNIFISDHIGICVIVVSNTIGTILKSFLNGNVEIKSSNSTTFSYSSMSPFFNKTEEINSLKTVESKMDFKLFTTENIISIAYSISVTLMAMVMTDWFNNWTTQIHLKVVQCLRNSSVIQIEPNPEQDIASKELRAKLKNCMPSEMLIHNNSDASFLNDETEAADLIIQNGTLLDSEENDQISFHSAISNFDDHGF